MAADASNGYVVNCSVYLKSERKNRRIHGLGYDVVMKMARPFLNAIIISSLIIIFQVLVF